MSKVKTNSKNKGKASGKNNSNNWFIQQQNASNQNSNSEKDNSSKMPKASTYKSLETLPIVKVQMNSKREAEHFERAYQFALKNSDPKSQEIMTVHLDMKDEVHFNMVQDEAFKAAWQKGELMLLVAFPKNWKTMNLMADLDLEELEEDAEDFDFDSPEDRFDYLYENGMAVYEGKEGR